MAVPGCLGDLADRPPLQLTQLVDLRSENSLHDLGLRDPQSLEKEAIIFRENGLVEEEEWTNSFWSIFKGNWKKKKGCWLFLVKENIHESECLITQCHS